MHQYFWKLHGLGGPQDAARALLVAGLFDRIIFKHKLSPAEVAEAGIGLRELLPHGILVLRTERLNPLLRMLERGSASRQVGLLMEWVEWWSSVIQHGVSVQIDDTRDRAKLLSADALIQLLSLNLPQLSSITKVVRQKTYHRPAPALAPVLLRGQHYTALGGPDALRTIDLSTKLSAIERESTVLLVCGSPFDLHPLLSTLARPVTAPAIAALFLTSKPEPANVISHLLEAAMEKMGLGFAAAIRVSEEQQQALIDTFQDAAFHPHDLVHAITVRDRQFSHPRFRDSATWRNLDGNGDTPEDGPTLLICHQEDFAEEYVVDPRQHIDELFEAKFQALLRVQQGVEVAYRLPEAPVVRQLGAIRHELERRHVQVQMREAGSGKACSTLYPASDYAVEIFLDSIMRGVVADDAFPAHGLDFKQSGATLDISLTPLYMSGDLRYSLGQTRSIVLPRFGKSPTAKFTLRTPDELRKFRARIVILHQAEVLQTLILALEPIAGDASLGLPYRLVVESDLARPDAVVRPRHAQFQLALILNDNFNDAPGATLQAGTRALFTEPMGWQAFIADSQAILTQLTASDLLPTSLSDAILADSLRALAMQGVVALENLMNQAPDFDIKAASYVQVIEAVNSAFVPVELFYDAPAPDKNALVCPNAASALAEGSCTCNQQNPAKVICPIAFWGISKHIERRKNIPGASQSEVRIPRPGSIETIAFGKPLIGVSQNVEKADTLRLRNTMTAHFGDAHFADSWEAWTSMVKGHQPKLQVLLPHAGAAMCMPRHPALEINTDELLYGQINAAHVSLHRHQPVVLMLGCETGLSARFPVMNFASKFYAQGARTVLATLSEVRGRYVSRFAEELVSKLVTTGAAAPGQDFGSVLMAIKRAMLAGGNPMGLTLVTYGDTCWELRHG